MTTREPGASEVLMWRWTVRPLAAAFFASSPAASSTPGFEVLVHEVMAAISTSPWPMSSGLGPMAVTRSWVGRLSTISARFCGWPPSPGSFSALSSTGRGAAVSLVG